MRVNRPPLLLALAIALVALAAAVQPARAEVQPKPDFRAWNVRGNFTNGSARVMLTTYSGIYEPPQILSWTQTDISGDCTVLGGGSISYSGGQATFPGSAYLRCTLDPAAFAQYAPDKCETEAGGFWFFSGEGKIPSTSQANPIISASDGTFHFSLPGSGALTRTRAVLPSLGGPTTYLTPQWSRDASGNEVLIGQYGPLIIEASEEIGLLGNLTAGWKPYFTSVAQLEAGHRMYSAASVSEWQTSADPLLYEPPPPAVLFGYNPVSGVFYSGKLTHAEVDPPGCIVK